MKVLANDGISKSGEDKLRAYGFEVITENQPQDTLAGYINENNVDAVLVRSATKIRKDLIDACPNLKLIGRGGVGMDNIDVDYARKLGRHVINTPGASSQSVAELVMAQMFAVSRFLPYSFQDMPTKGATEFKQLKKAYAKGIELRGKTLLIVGFGRIGQALASYALGVGMKIIAVGQVEETVNVNLTIADNVVSVPVQVATDLSEALPKADFISLHVPAQPNGEAVIGESQFKLMKETAVIVNCARGGVIDETALINALENKEIGVVALDVFANEPTPRQDVLENNLIACTPHIGAATVEAQDRIGEELADQINDLLK